VVIVFNKGCSVVMACCGGDRFYFIIRGFSCCVFGGGGGVCECVNVASTSVEVVAVN